RGAQSPGSQLLDQPLVEESRDEQNGADRHERERAGHRRQRGEVVEEDLRQGSAEEDERGHPKRATSANQADVQERERDERPDRADDGGPALEPLRDGARRQTFEHLQHRQRDRIERQEAERTERRNLCPRRKAEQTRGRITVPLRPSFFLATRRATEAARDG